METVKPSLMFCVLSLIVTASASEKIFPTKMATQSGTYHPSSNAANAVDGDPSTCTTAAESNETLRNITYGWWQVDLGDTFNVVSINLTNGGSDGLFLRNFAVFIGCTKDIDVQSSSICYTYSSDSYVPLGTEITITCSRNPLSGRYVTIKRIGGDRHDAIALCEVKIFYHIDGYVDLFNLPTNQTGIRNQLASYRAVDLDVESCAETSNDRDNGQWNIDLLQTYKITGVVVFNSKNGETGYMSNFEVRVGLSSDFNSQTLCNYYGNTVPAGGNVTLLCNMPLTGRHLSVRRIGGTSNYPDARIFYLCEIFIMFNIYCGDIPKLPSVIMVQSSESELDKLKAAVVVLAIVSGLSFVVIGVLVIYPLGKRKSPVADTTPDSQDEPRTYEKLRPVRTGDVEASSSLPQTRRATIYPALEESACKQ